MTAEEAAGRVVHTLAIVPAGVPVAPVPPAVTETAAEAYARGEGLYAQKRYAEALASFERALQIDPQDAVAWNNKGGMLDNLKRPTEALAAYERALALDPQEALAWNNKIALLKLLGRKAEAAEAERQRDAALPRRS